MDDKKVLILVLAADLNGYDQLVTSIRETWGSTKSKAVEILYYYGYRQHYPEPPPGGVIKIDDNLICGFKENMANINAKTQAAFNYILHHYSFEYLFRCCAGSYIVQDNLLKFLRNKPKDRFYSGFIGECDAISFASGSGFFLSRDLVTFLLANPSGFYCHYHDDVAIGKFFQNKGIHPVPAPRQDFLDGVIRDFDPTQYHYHFFNNPRLMREIHQRVNGEAD